MLAQADVMDSDDEVEAAEADGANTQSQGGWGAMLSDKVNKKYTCNMPRK